MMRVGIAGIGFMGWIHYLAMKRIDSIQLGGIMAPEPERRAGDWTAIKGNFGPQGEKVDLTGVNAYDSLDGLFADPEIDLVDICLPPSLHAEACIKALNAGKHVFCEKPMALKAGDCDAMLAAAEKNGKQLFVAHVLPYFPEYIEARKVIDSGEYGKLLGGTFKRVISDPTWLRNFYDPELIGGPLLDLHIHDAHLIRLLFGMPVEVTCKGRMRGEVVEYCNTMFSFENQDLVVSAASGVINQQGRPFTHGFEIHLENATLHFEFAAFADEGESMPFKIVTPDGKVVRPELKTGDDIAGFENEYREVIRAIEAEETSSVLSGQLARDAIMLCNKQAESVRLGKPVSIS